MNARESVNKIFSDIFTEQNFCSASCFEKNEEPFFYSVKDGICTEQRTRTKRQLKSGLLKNEMTISDGIEAFTNKLTDDKFYSFELNIKNKSHFCSFPQLYFHRNKQLRKHMFHLVFSRDIHFLKYSKRLKQLNHSQKTSTNKKRAFN